MTVEINFIVQPKKKRFISVITVLLLVILLACTGLLFWQRSFIDSQVDDMQVQWKKNNTTLNDRTGSHNLQRQRSELAKRVQTVETALFSTRDLMEDVASLLPKNSYLSNFAYNQTEGVKLTIAADSLSGAAAFSEALTNQPYIEESSLIDVYPQETKDSQIYQTSFRFQVDPERFKEVMGDGA
ncbi:hypothetical protein [Sediminibacillus halophilus]|uniref:Type IV pilus assembly protein PilN n=1 Tax=Sediminibacillus halophilus TaxID=482461 RepID=A0A1G9XQ56_9BACI|nr:hypothetical protein [Sediminibacillus halophilus]SDM98403.1 hypothetical protein SAMN05216244_3901 [Sediminibacillus halophilus]